MWFPRNYYGRCGTDNVVYPEPQITILGVVNPGVLENHISLDFSCGIPEKIMWTNYIKIMWFFGDVVAPDR